MWRKGPKQVEIIFAHGMIGAQPHKDQNDTQGSGEEKYKSIQSGKYSFC